MDEPKQDKSQPVEGEIVREMRDAAEKGGVFIGSLNIMTSPARGFITKPLADLYARRYHGKFPRPKHTFAFDLGLVALGIAIAAVAVYFWFFYKPYDPIGSSLIIAPKQLIAGGEAVARLRIENNSAHTLDEVNVVLNLPPNIAVSKISLPFDAKTGRIEYGTIEPGGIAEARITGTITGAVGTSHRVAAIVSYHDRDNGKRGTSPLVGTIKIERSAVGAEIELPDTIIVGTEIEGRIRYRNRATTAQERIVIIPRWPEGFSFTDAAPALRNGVWPVGTVPGGAEGVVVFRGMMAPEGERVAFGAEIGVQRGPDLLRQGGSEGSAALVDSQISLKVEGADAARLGETVTLLARYRNDGPYTLTGARILANAEHGGEIVRIEEGAIGDLAPGKTGVTRVTVRLPRALPAEQAETDEPAVRVRAWVTGTFTGPETAEASLFAPTVAIRIATTLGLSAAARYYAESGDQLGRGPLPPAVGQATKYWVFWNIQNSWSGAGGVRVSGTLPANVSWTGKASLPYGDPLQFDPGSRRLTWNVGTIPARPGVTSPAIGAAFEIQLIPTPDQAGTTPLLVSDQRVSATDSATGLSVSGFASNLTTRLEVDPKASGKDVVK